MEMLSLRMCDGAACKDYAASRQKVSTRGPFSPFHYVDDCEVDSKDLTLN